MDEREVTNKYGRDHHFVLFGGDAATAANWGPFFIASHPIEIVRVFVSWGANSSSGTFQLEKLEPGVALGSGSDVLSTALSTASGANTPVELTKKDLTTSRVLKAGDRLALEDGGTLTGLQNLQVTLYYVPTGRGAFIP